MNENDLMNLWNSNDSNEKKVFEENQARFAQIAQRKSNDIFKRIERNIILEALATVALIFIIPKVFYDELDQPLILGVFIAALLLALVIYGRYFYQIRSIQEAAVIDSLRLKIKVLTNYVNQLKLYNYILTPLGYLFGLYLKLPAEELPAKLWWLLIGISVVVLPLVLWLVGKYI